MRVSRFVVAWVLAGVVVRGVEAQSPAEDCNFNGVLDSVEIAGGLSDCNADGIPDECELSPALSFEDPVVQRFGGFQVDPSMLERGDLDGDGLEDFATVWRNTVVLLWNEGGGDFEIESRRTATLSSTSGTSFQLLQLADLDGDGLPELLIAGSLVPGMLATFSNLGNRRFGDREVLPFPFPFSGNPNSLVRSIHAGHFDGDDREDLAVLIGHEPDHSVQILLNRRGELTQGPGVSLSSDRTDGPNSAPSVFVGDFDGDGRDDLLRTLRRAEDVPETAPGTVPTYRVIWNQGVGNFFAPVDLIPNRNVFGDPQIVDIDGDGADEIYFVQALVTAAPEFQSRDVQTSFAFSGIGRSFELTRYSLGTRTVLWGDLDLDGDSDAVTIRGSRGGLATVFENLEGNLTQSTSLGRLPASLLSDFDADGRLDLVGFQNQATISRRNENGFEFASEEIVAPLLSESTFVVALPPAPNSTVPRIAAASLGDTRFYIVGESNGFVEIGYGGLVDAATADLNRDGIADMIVAHEGGTTIALANESGFFDSTDREVVESGPVHSVRAEDLDGDGWVDLVFGSENSVRVLLSDRGVFPDTGRLIANQRARVVEIVDLDRDAAPDLVLLDETNSLLLVLWNESGEFSETTEISLNGRPSAAISLEVDGDEHLDLAVAHAERNSVIVYHSNSNRGFVAGSETETSSEPVSLAKGDFFISDGFDDLIVSERGAGTIRVYQNDRSGGFDARQVLFEGRRPSQITTGHYDDDEIIDVVGVHEGYAGAIFNGVVAVPVTALSSQSPDCNENALPDDCDIASGIPDVNRDGVPDTCQGALFVRGDADGSGAINITDAIFVFNWLFLGGRDPECTDSVDTDDSGLVDLTDGITILNFLKLGGPAPQPPYPHCGEDSTVDNLGCENYSCR